MKSFLTATVCRVVLSCVVLIACLDANALAESLAGTRPNIILVMTDDQGMGDLSCLGNPVLRTPNLDRFYEMSTRFTDFHVSPTCAPTRSSIFSGRHEFRNGVTHTIKERERMALSTTTFPQLLQQGRLRDRHLRQVASWRRRRVSALQSRIQRSLHSWGRRHRTSLRRELCRLSAEPRTSRTLFRQRDPAQRHDRADQGILHRRVLRGGAWLDQAPTRSEDSVLCLHHDECSAWADDGSGKIQATICGTWLGRESSRPVWHDREHRRQLRHADAEVG